jgi:hypothetical protein
VQMIESLEQQNKEFAKELSMYKKDMLEARE